MIKFIEIAGFQSHKNTRLEFSKGVNAIVGESDSGKSAILRAIRLVAQNKPAGSGYINSKSDVCNVRIGIGDESSIDVVERLRSKTENGYTLSGEKFSAFGSSVPESVVDAFSFHDVNMQHQLDAPFLLSKTPGEIGQYLNAVVNLELVDEVVKIVKQMNRGTKNEISLTQSAIKEHEETVSRYSWLPEAEALCEKIAAATESIERKTEQADELKAIVARIKSVKVVNIDGVQPLLDDIEEAKLNHEKCYEEGKAIAEAVDRLKAWNAKAESTSGMMKNIEAKLAEFKICEACGRPL